MITRINLKEVPIPAYDLYIGRTNTWVGLEGSKWANPFVLKRESEREEVLNKYEEYIINSPELMNSLWELKDLVLACWCSKHKKCHGDVLIKLFNEKYNIENESK